MSANSTSLAMNIVMSSAIKGATFLQASTQGIHKYSTSVQRINLLKATKFGQLNKNVKTLDNHLTKLSIKSNHISKNPIKLEVNRTGLMEARKDITAIERSAQRASHFSTQIKPKVAKTQVGAVNTSDVMSKVMFAGALALPFKASIDFESSMARVQALSNTTKKPLVFKALVKTAKDLGASTEYSATDVAQGMQYLSMAGFKANDTIKAMPGLLALATAGQTDLATTSDISSNILSGFSLKASEMTRVADVMSKTMTTANVDTRMLGETMKYAAPVASGLGASIEEVATLSAKMGDVGIQGSMAGTAIRTMYSRLSAPPTAGAKALASLGVTTFDSTGKFKGMINIIGELNTAMAGLNDGEKSEMMKSIFGMEAMSGASTVMKVGKKTLLSYQATLENSAGSAKEIQKIQLATTAGQFKLLGSALEGLSISATTGLLPFINMLTSGITYIAGGLQWFTETFPMASTVVLGLGATVILGSIALATFGFVVNMASVGLTRLGALGSVIGFMRSFSLVTSIATAKQWLLNMALNANPIGLLVVGVSALIGLGVVLYKNFEPVRVLFDKIASVIKAVVGGVISFGKSIGSGVMSFFGFGGDDKAVTDPGNKNVTVQDVKTNINNLSANNQDYKNETKVAQTNLSNTKDDNSSSSNSFMSFFGFGSDDKKATPKVETVKTNIQTVSPVQPTVNDIRLTTNQTPANNITTTKPVTNTSFVNVTEQQLKNVNTIEPVLNKSLSTQTNSINTIAPVQTNIENKKDDNSKINKFMSFFGLGTDKKVTAPGQNIVTAETVKTNIQKVAPVQPTVNDIRLTTNQTPANNIIGTQPVVKNVNFTPSLKTPTIEQLPSFNQITEQYTQTSSFTGSNSPAGGNTITIENINVTVSSIDGKFDEEVFTEQVERAIKRIKLENQDTQMEDIA